MRLVIIGLIFITALAAWLNNPTAVTNNKSSTKAPFINTPLPTQDTGSVDIPEKVTTSPSESKSIAGGNTPDLSPEMKQALKDKLLHHGPKTISKDGKGRTILHHEGRFTQMPVAIRQADGSIKIKEYTVVPDNTGQSK